MHGPAQTWADDEIYVMQTHQTNPCGHADVESINWP